MNSRVIGLAVSSALILALGSAALAQAQEFSGTSVLRMRVLEKPILEGPLSLKIEDRLSSWYTVGDVYASRLERAGGKGRITFSGSGPLTVSGDGGVNGTFMLPGFFEQSFTATDANGAEVSIGPFPISVERPLELASPVNPVAVKVGAERRVPLPDVDGGLPPYSYELSVPSIFHGTATLEEDETIVIDLSEDGFFDLGLSVIDARGRRDSVVLGVQHAVLVGSTTETEARSCTGNTFGTQTRSREVLEYSGEYFEYGAWGSWAGTCNPASAVKVQYTEFYGLGSGDCGPNGPEGTNHVWSERIVTVRYNGNITRGSGTRYATCNQNGGVTAYDYRDCPNHAYGQQRATAIWYSQHHPWRSQKRVTGAWEDFTCTD